MTALAVSPKENKSFVALKPTAREAEKQLKILLLPEAIRSVVIEYVGSPDFQRWIPQSLIDDSLVERIIVGHTCPLRQKTFRELAITVLSHPRSVHYLIMKINNAVFYDAEAAHKRLRCAPDFKGPIGEEEITSVHYYAVDERGITLYESFPNCSAFEDLPDNEVFAFSLTVCNEAQQARLSLLQNPNHPQFLEILQLSIDDEPLKILADNRVDALVQYIATAPTADVAEMRYNECAYQFMSNTIIQEALGNLM
ncbi:MAG TPA: hypothetical protein VN457_03695, partial [Chlamydiales bacterium]|nr:hypothetical protein [Chlamydiales bacterium]